MLNTAVRRFFQRATRPNPYDEVVAKNSRAAAHLIGGRRTSSWWRVVVLVLLALLLTFGTALWSAWARYQGNITRADIDDLVPSAAAAEPVDPSAGRPLNILVLGSDVRSGASDIDNAGESGEVGGMRADTTMIMHISADRSRVDIVSVPRDTLVDIPSCTIRTSSGGSETVTTRPAPETMFNSAFAIGGQYGDVASAAACTMTTLHQMTGITFNGYIVVDFASFISTVDALGGVPMYFADDLYDERAGLDIASGCRLLNGTQALALARARYSVGDGSDISRIGRQHELVSAVAAEALRSNLLTDFGRLMRLLDAATQSLQTSQEIGSISNIVGLANSLRSIDPANIRFWTMPFAWAGNRVVATDSAEYVWEALRRDVPVRAEKNADGVFIGLPPEGSPDALPSTAAGATPSAGITAAGSEGASGAAGGADSDTAATDANSESTPTPASPGADETASATSPTTAQSTESAPVCTRENAIP